MRSSKPSSGITGAPRAWSTEGPRWLSTAILGACALAVAFSFRAPRESTSFHLMAFGRLPVLEGGRIKPLDTVARTSLLMMSGKQTIPMEGHSASALEWLTDVLFKPTQADFYPVFEIDNPDVLGMMGLRQTQKRRFAFADIAPHVDEISKQAAQADLLKSEERSRYQTAVVNLENQITLYQKLQNTLQLAGSENLVAALQDFEQRLGPALTAHLKSRQRNTEMVGPLMKELENYRFLDHVAAFYPLPSLWAHQNPDSWTSFGRGVFQRLNTAGYGPGVMAYATLSDTWRSGDALAFNETLQNFQNFLHGIVPAESRKAACEFVFNYVQPFYQSLALYLVAFLLAFCSWIVWPRTLNRAAFQVLLFAFAVHTAGLIARMWIGGRPPVTNLYSSAIFVGWVAVALGIVLERLYRNGIGSVVASTIGFITLIIAHHLAASGDTLEMMRAVLDSNMWLATHVVCITVGYGSTFLSGFLAILYILRRLLDPHWNEKTAQSLERMVYGVVCFATFFSFLGTILGGIWADQSWGRFWGWDPKENGALMIVLWNVFILHARLGGHARRKTLMVLAVFGNVVTALSWFGVNMLGIGLHSYGFMDKAFVWLIVFALSQFLLMSLAFVGDGL